MRVVPLTLSRGTLVAVALVVAFATGATATGQYDAMNADKVDGRDAVGPAAGAADRAGKLVATDGDGLLPRGAVGTAPDAARLGGAPASALRWQTIEPQSGVVTGGASAGTAGPSLPPGTEGGFVVGVVVPPSHDAADALRMRVTYLVDDTAACAWSMETEGLQGPDAPNDQYNVHNGYWKAPGASSGSATLSVPAGNGSVHRTTLTWGFQDTPGTFVQLHLSRFGADPADTCEGYVTVVGLELRW